MGRSHALSGACAGLLVGALSGSPAIGLLCGAVGFLCSWGPDLDHPAGRPARVLGPVTWLLCRIVRGASHVVGLPRHRGLTHTVLAAVVVGLVAGQVAFVWLDRGDCLFVAGAASAGYAAALLGDWITRSSLPHLLFPFVAVTPGPPQWMRLSTGKAAERWLVVPLLSVAVVACAGLVLGVLR